MSADKPVRNITSATITGIISRVISFGGTFLLVRLMLAKLGNVDYGIWITISSSVSLLSFLDLGIGNSLVNYIAGAGNDREKIRGYVTLACRFQVVFAAILLVIFAAAFPFVNWNKALGIAKDVPGLHIVIFVTGAFFLLSLASNSIYAIQRGMRRADLANLCQLAASIFYMLAIWTALQFSSDLLWIALATFGIPVLIASINAVWYLKKEKLVTAGLKTTIDPTGRKAFFKISSLFLYLQVAAVIAFQTDALVIAHVLNFDDVAKYSVVTKLFSAPVILVSVYLQNIWPVYTASPLKYSRRLFTRSVLMTSGATLLFCAAVFFLRRPILAAWLTNLINIPASLMLAVALWTVINIIDMNISTVLNAFSILKFQVVFSLLMILSNLGLSILLAKHYGVRGVVWGTILSTLFFSTLPMLCYLLYSVFPKKASGVA